MYATIEKAVLEGIKDAESILKGICSFLNENSAVILRTLWQLIVLAARFFAGALVIEALAGINPELREMVPSLYRITDVAMMVLEKICKDDLGFLKL